MDESRVTVILGPPGTGKTTRAMDLLEEALTAGIPPDRIGFFSFTKKAAEEGISRASLRFSLPQDSFRYMRTIHSLAFKQLNMRRDRVFGWPHLKELGRILGMDFKGRHQVDDGDVYGMNSADRLLFLEGLARNSKKPLKQVWSEAMEDSIDWFELERFSRGLQKFKADRQLYDFTDIIERFCQVSVSQLPKFDLLIIDEAQDLSSLQWDAVERIATNAKKIYVLGDDCQAIYIWSGADVKHFIDLRGQQITLDQSNRIPSTIHALADSITDKIVDKRHPRLWKPKEEKGAINWFGSMDEVDVSSGKWLLLARNGYMLNAMEDWCMSQGFSFNSINRDPLKSPSLAAIKVWEELRRKKEQSASDILDALQYLSRQAVPPTLMKEVKANEQQGFYTMENLVNMGLRTTAIWHEALTKISVKERDFFIAARRRGESLLKEPRIKISTIHAAKGGEADHTLLLTDMSYRCYNNMDKNFDDESRVWNVGCTRSKQTLNLIMPQTNLNFNL